MTLPQFVKKCGGQEKAARLLGVSTQTVYRWVHDKVAPSDMAKAILRTHGVVVK